MYICERGMKQFLKVGDLISIRYHFCRFGISEGRFGDPMENLGRIATQIIWIL